jgi:hypothetical protein
MKGSIRAASSVDVTQAATSGIAMPLTVARAVPLPSNVIVACAGGMPSAMHTRAFATAAPTAAFTAPAGGRTWSSRGRSGVVATGASGLSPTASFIAAPRSASFDMTDDDVGRGATTCTGAGGFGRAIADAMIIGGCGVVDGGSSECAAAIGAGVRAIATIGRLSRRLTMNAPMASAMAIAIA